MAAGFMEILRIFACDFLKCLNDHGVEYLLIGGHAVAYHGYVRRS